MARDVNGAAVSRVAGTDKNGNTFVPGVAPPGLKAENVSGAWSISGVPDHAGSALEPSLFFQLRAMSLSKAGAPIS